MPVVVVGPLAFDDVRTATDARSGQLGGSGAYASIAAAKLAPTALVSVVGRDLSDADLGSLVSAGVDVSGVERRAGRTLRWSGVYDSTTRKSEVRNTDLGVVPGWRPQVPRAWVDTPYLLLANTDPAVQVLALAQLRPALAVLDTMEEWIAGHRRAVEEAIAGVGVVAVNERELALLARAKGASAVLARGPHAVIVKRGPGGARLVTNGGSFSVPAYPAEAVDPTGAGDALAGAFVARLAAVGRADEPALEDALAYGVAAASFAIGSFSVAALAAATREEIETRAHWVRSRARRGTDQPVVL